MRITLALVLSLAFSLGVAGQAGEDAVDKERKLYQGVWKVTSFVLDGKEVDQNNAAKLLFINKADGAWIVEADGKEISSGKSDIDPTQKPKTIDFMPTSGVFSGNEYLGIYELGKDARKICFAEKSKGRPAAFEAPEGSGRFLLTFERVKK
ncbi:MAG: TIGR03067 domain-containing protein [Gemmataceae bacterium]|nr:TIGR03067 domain-containing protein [Gemmataceae bacterium]